MKLYISFELVEQIMMTMLGKNLEMTTIKLNVKSKSNNSEQTEIRQTRKVTFLTCNSVHVGLLLAYWTDILHVLIYVNILYAQ
jgi:hypothetical protein